MKTVLEVVGENEPTLVAYAGILPSGRSAAED